MKITSFTSVGNDKYVMEIEQLSDSYIFGDSTNSHRTIHLRFAPHKLGDNPAKVTKEKFLEAIQQLKADFEKGVPSRFGTLGQGLKKMWFRKNHWQSNAISIIEEFDGRKVVYSFANPT